ncbi:hypothetical protein XENORESO_010040 [Xenotaenia resolanae]|uniref:Uncharacterized protein n=1 Tax=Xenotaenia resolanae TaxID=208358 RepID=A0ABV0VQ20_9TELE
MILKSEIDSQIPPEDLDPCKSTCSLPTDTSQPSDQHHAPAVGHPLPNICGYISVTTHRSETQKGFVITYCKNGGR